MSVAVIRDDSSERLDATQHAAGCGVLVIYTYIYIYKIYLVYNIIPGIFFIYI